MLFFPRVIILSLKKNPLQSFNKFVIEILYLLVAELSIY